MTELFKTYSLKNPKLVDDTIWINNWSDPDGNSKPVDWYVADTEKAIAYWQDYDNLSDAEKMAFEIYPGVEQHEPNKPVSNDEHFDATIRYRVYRSIVIDKDKREKKARRVARKKAKKGQLRLF